jgi:Tfp pilus assembly protein PilN
MGARAVAVGLTGATAWYAYEWNSLALPLWAVFWRVMLVCVLAGTAGKLLGILIFKLQSKILQRRNLQLTSDIQ